MRRLEEVAVGLVCLHSLAIGMVLLFATQWGLGFGGFGATAPLFFARQAGAFHVVVAAGYAAEYARHRTITLLVTTKAIAVLFLTLVWIGGGDAPWSVPFSAAADAAMGVAMLVLHRRAEEAGA